MTREAIGMFVIKGWAIVVLMIYYAREVDARESETGLGNVEGSLFLEPSIKLLRHYYVPYYYSRAFFRCSREERSEPITLC